MMQQTYNIKELLQEAHKTISYHQMGKLFGVSAVTVMRWAKGKRKPSQATIRRIIPILEDMLELSANIPLGDPLYHGGPPDNEFSWRKTDPPLLKKALNLMVRYAGVLNITNKEMMDTAGLYIRQVYKEYKVGRSQVSMLALAALKVASLKHLKYIDIKNFITDEKVFEQFWFVISKNLYK